MLLKTVCRGDLKGHTVVTVQDIKFCNYSALQATPQEVLSLVGHFAFAWV